MQRVEDSSKRKRKGDEVARKGGNPSGEIRPHYAGRQPQPEPTGKKWWDPIKDVVFPHRAVRKKQELRRRNTMGPQTMPQSRGFPQGHSVHPAAVPPGMHPAGLQYPGFMPPTHSAPGYPPGGPGQPHPAGYLHPHAMYPPFFGMHHRPSLPYLPGEMQAPPQGYNPRGYGGGGGGRGPMSTGRHDDDDAESECSVMDPSFYTIPSEVGVRSHASSSRKAVVTSSSKSGHKPGGRRKHKSPPTLQAPDPLAEGYNTLGREDIVYESGSDREEGRQSPDGDGDLIKGFDNFMLY